jgi:hypothetical protein
VSLLRQRLANLSVGEIVWRTRARLQIETDRVAVALRTPGWRRSALGDVLAPAVVDDDLEVAMATQEWGRVQRRLEERLLARPSRFVLDSGKRVRLRHAVLDRFADAPAVAAARADAMLGGTYSLLGYEAICWPLVDGAPDWHCDPVNGGTPPRRFWASVAYLDPRHGDHKVIWELNRHQHWFAFGRAAWLTGDPRYANAVVHQLRSWLANNPPLVGINWASMLELGFRSIAWTWSLHMLLGLADEERRPLSRTGWLIDMLIALDRQLTHVANNLSHFFSPNTHLTGEALSLYVVGTALPELARSARFAATGRDVLLAELDRQVLADGGHAERSTHYHRYTLDFYLLALETAILAGDQHAEARFRAGCHRLATFMHALSDDNGHVPVIGDDDGGRLWPVMRSEPYDVRATLSHAAVLLRRPELAPWPLPEEVCWTTDADLAAAERDASTSRVRGRGDGLRVFPDTGLVVARDEGGGHLVMDVGSHGYLNGGHAHADALAVTLSADGRPILVDPGTGSYTMDRALRDRQRSSASHNTVTVDGRSSSVPAGPFHWSVRADAQLHGACGNSALAWVEAWHDGYAPLRHRRTVVSAAGAGWLFVDELLGDGEHGVAPHDTTSHSAVSQSAASYKADVHSVDANWHFDVGWSVTAGAANRLRAADEDGRVAWLAHDGGVATLLETDRWPVYGRRLAAPTVRIRHASRVPSSSVTWLGIGVTQPTIERLVIDCDTGGTAIATRLRRARSTWTTVLRPGEPAARDLRSCASADYHTNARMLHYGEADNGWTVLAIVDASHALALHDGLVSAASETSIRDLHVAIDGERLFLHSARPPAGLRLEGQRLTSVRTLVLNGRSLRRAGAGTELLVVSGADWAEAQFDGAGPFDPSAPWLGDEECRPGEAPRPPAAGRFHLRAPRYGGQVASRPTPGVMEM